MNRPEIFIAVTLLLFALTACDQQHKQQPITQKGNINQPANAYHCVYTDDPAKNCKCPIQLELKDSSILTHIKNSFYKSKTGHLYEKTWAQRQLKGQDTLSSVLYFNGYISQEIDPVTFEPLNGWYAKDKNYIYYYRPVSGGMQISKIDTADTPTFKLLPGHYKYAMDKSFFYNETQIIEGFSPATTKQQLDDKGRVYEMISNNKKYTFELVN